MQGYQGQVVRMADCGCGRGLTEEYKCAREDCSNYGETYCQDCVNDFQNHLHPAKKYS
jgi:hypothetical protein